MPEQPYKRPPITEAIIEVRFADEASPAQLERIMSGFASSYPHQQMQRNVGFAVAVPPELSEQPSAQFNQQIGYRSLRRILQRSFWCGRLFLLCHNSRPIRAGKPFLHGSPATGQVGKDLPDTGASCV